MKRAKAGVLNKNDRQIEADFTIKGNPKLVAGSNITITGFYSLNGLYHINCSKHKIYRGQGYKTYLEITRNDIKEEEKAVSTTKGKITYPTLANPNKMVYIDGGFPVQAHTAQKWEALKGLIKKRFPGRSIIVTCTTGGVHQSPAHPSGRAIDFCVTGLTKQESIELEQMAKQCGFYPYNEYINTSKYKTGDHMHVED